MKSRHVTIASIFTLVLLFYGCSSAEENSDKESSQTEQHEHQETGSPEIPEGLEPAADPKYKEGSQVILKANHMEGMDGAEATVLNAFDTIAYQVTYTPTTGGEPVKNHKWVIQDEIKDAGSEMLEKETEVTLEADHMEGMKGAKATIESAENTTVYMVDYQPTTGGEMITNHKWVTEEEVFAE
ncbi:YdhK family protein [Niallia sp. MER TA 168]|uniref:YdhK family protein n=1 Tax=Niallia sp. MER TA 168 TaxID=2939568 RepID=UPI00203BD466|nr:YdhK family protein [Niallia sp. MER TA 168]MCM3362798.1 YdhK family protein [Niallia sp. MER TA 168]